jgi:hypothetical protein
MDIAVCEEIDPIIYVIGNLNRTIISKGVIIYPHWMNMAHACIRLNLILNAILEQYTMRIKVAYGLNQERYHFLAAGNGYIAVYQGSSLMWQSKSEFVPSIIYLIPFRYNLHLI